jgi:hypothetical protein
MPTNTGVKVSEVKKRAERLDMDRLIELVNYRREDGTWLSHQEISDRMGCSRVAVTRAIQRVPEWQIKERDLEQFKRERADIFAAAQQLVLKYLTHDKLKKASPQQIATLMAIFYDKERLERGKATQHVANLTDIQLDKETKKLLQEAIVSRTKAMLDKTSIKQIGNDAETSDSGDSDDDGVSTIEED